MGRMRRVRDTVDISRFLTDRDAKLGAAPGTVTFVGEESAGEPQITLYTYSGDTVQRSAFDSVDAALDAADDADKAWLDIDGVHETRLIEQVGDRLGLHPLTQEDIANTDQRPKLEEFDDHLFLIVKMLRYDSGAAEVVGEQLSLVLFDDLLITFQEVPGDVFDPVRTRLETGKGRLRQEPVDYCAYALLDAIVDNYFSVLEQIGDRVEDAEENLVTDPDPETLQDIHGLKRELIYLRKAVWPLREVVSRLERSDHVSDTTRRYLRDVYEHTVQVIDIIETFRDMVSGTLDVYLSSISNRMNQVMKVLTVIGSIFIPLTFITGLYGMNFNPAASPFNMPELNWYWGYPAVLLAMTLLGLGMTYYFWQKDWF